MYEGEIVEKGTRDQIINFPTHPYTKLLLSSNFSIYEDDEYFMEEFDKFDMNIEIIHDGCKFYGRCPFRSEICKEKETKLKEISNGHFTSCHMV